MTIPDNYFREEMEKMKMPPPPGAWDRIQPFIHKKTYTSWWLAAASLIIVIATSVVMMTNRNGTNEVIVENIPPSKFEIQQPVELPRAEKESIASAEKPDVAPGSIQKNTYESNPPASSKTEMRPIALLEPASSSIEILPIHVNPEESKPSVTPPDEQFIQVPESDKTIVNGKKLKYSAAEVQARFMKKKEIKTATPPPPGRFDRIADMASNINYTNAIGELRQMKNELLAFPAKGPSRDKKIN
jgi:hypothetical protein